MECLPRSTKYPIISLHPSDFNVTNDENKFVFVGKVYGTTNINENMDKVYKILENFSVCDEKELLNANNGIYTWLLYSNNDNLNEMKFIATEVLSPYEIGTNHQSIAYNKRVNASFIYGAGELKKLDNQITFNLISGSYTKNIIGYDFEKVKTNIIVNKFIEIFQQEKEYNIIYDNTRDSYIYKVTSVSNKLLELYKNNNYVVRIFDNNNDCVKYNNSFWHFDWSLEYYKKKIDTDEDKKLMLKMYTSTLDLMINLLKE
jgi:hypothetical protein